MSWIKMMIWPFILGLMLTTMWTFIVAVVFYLLWNWLAPIYLNFLPQIWLKIPFWNFIGLCLLVIYLKTLFFIGINIKSNQ